MARNLKYDNENDQIFKALSRLGCTPAAVTNVLGLQPSPTYTPDNVETENSAHQSLFDALTKIGVSPGDIALVLGIEPKAAREKRQADYKAEQDKIRADWEAGQAFDKAEREKIQKDIVPAPVAAGDIKVAVALTSATSINVNYTNTTKQAVTLKVRVGSNDRPDRLIAAGKTATSTYTTTLKTGFTGQKLVVTHAETGTIIHSITL
jgi:hypothetical protein